MANNKLLSLQEKIIQSIHISEIENNAFVSTQRNITHSIASGRLLIIVKCVASSRLNSENRKIKTDIIIQKRP